MGNCGGASASTGSTNHCSFAVDGGAIYVGYQDADNGDAATVRKYNDCSPTSSTTNTTAFCSYLWNGVTYTTSGTFTKTFTAGNSQGCDSVAILNLTIYSTPLGNALHFDGSDYVATASTLGISGTGSFTVEAWVKTTGTQSSAVVAKRGTGGYGNFFGLLINSAGKPYFELNESDASNYTAAFGNTSVNDGNWHHIAAVKTASQVLIYVDGVSDATPVTISGNPNINNTTVCTVGTLINESGNRFGLYTGSIDEVRLWNTERTQNQLQANMNKELVGNETGLTAYFNFNQGTANGNNSGVTTLLDKTANNRNGTLTTFSLSGSTSNWVANSKVFASTTSIAICSSALPYSWNGLTFTAAGTRTASLTNAKGCDSVATLNLTINASPVISSTGNALSFDGVNDYVSIPNGYAATDNITYETWLNASSFNLGDFNVLLAHDNWATGYIHFQFQGGFLHFDVNGIGNISTNYAFNTNTWYHVAVTYSKSQGLVKFYVNGNLSSTYPFSNGPSIAGGIGKIMGAYSNQRFFNGKIDEFRVWNVVRTQAEIQSSMNTELLGNEAGLVEYYNFNQGVAGGINSSVTTLLDKTTSGHNGTLNNFTLSGSTSNWTSNTNLATAYAAGTQTVCMGTAATSFSPTVTGATSYQWYSNTTLSTSGSTPISGANAASYTAPTTIAGTKYYYVEAGMAAGCNVQSSIQTVITKPTSTSTTNLTICNSALPYVWNGLTFNTAGSQTKTGLTNSAGCDSVATLNLTLKTNYTVTASAGSNGIISNAGASTICSGNSSATYSITPNSGYNIAEVLVDGVSQGAITTYSFSNVTANHTIAASFTLSCTPSTSSVAQTACVSYTWNGVTYTTSGTYFKTFTAGNAKGCDSTAILNLTVKTTTSSTQNIAVCSSGLPYSWNGSRTAAGTYTFTTTSSEGCDSVATLNLTVNSFPTVGIIANGANTICNGSSVSLKLVRTTVGNVCATQVENGTFQIQAPPNAVFTSIVFASFGTPNGSCGSFSIGGCHSSNSVSVVSGYLLGNNSASFVVSNGVFGGDPCILIGKSLYVEAQYTIYDTTGLTNLWSTNAVTASITVNPNVTTTYIVVAKDVNGCTGTANKTIIVKATSTSTTNVSICSSVLPYSWNGSRAAAGTYTFTTTNSQGCDSVATLNLTLKTNTTSTTNTSICSSALPYSWNGSRTVAGTYTFTTTNSQGCDSVATLYLSVKTSTASTTNISICQSSLPYNWNGLSFTDAGSQTKAGFVNSQGCDSSATLNLTVKTGKTSTSNVSICATALPYNWNGSKTAAGTYTFTTTISQSCDSVATLNLTVKTTTSSTQNIAVCSSALPYSWNGDRAAAGTYTFTTTNSQGCDSVATLILTIRTNTSSINNIIICSSALPFSWNGLNFNAAGSQTKTGLLNSQGCDSSATLNLTVKTITTSTTIINICSNLLPYSWNGSRTTSGTYTFNTTNSQGCDSVATLNLTVKQQTSSSNIASVCSNQLPYIWNGLSFAAAGSKTKTGLVNSVGCDSSATLILSVSTSSASSISISSTATSICEGASITFTATPVNGGTAPIYQWKKNGVNVGTNTNTFSNNLLASGDSIWCVLTSNSACVTNTSSTSNKVSVLVNANPAITPIITGLSPFETVILCKLNTTYRYDNATINGIWTISDSTIASVTGVGKTCIVTTKSSGSAILRYTVINTFGCSSSTTVFLGVFPQEVPKAIIGNDNICVNTISALSSTLPYNSTGYWQCQDSRGSITQSGVYTAKAAGVGVVLYSVTNNSTGCSAFTSISMNIHSLPTVPFVYYADGTIVNPQTGSNGSFCANRIFTVVGNPSGGIWSKTGVLTVGANSGVVNTGNAAGAGSLTYTYKNVNGCSNSRTISGNVAVCASRGVNGGTNEKLETRNEFTMYPNPAKTFISLNVKTLIGAGTIVITDLYGKKVKTQPLSMGTNTIDISTFAKGIYLVSTITNEVKNTKKLVVE